ncbi:MAG TPA: hypothetical protein VFL96_16490 [Acidobacteriaceae bacterium]|nr:hypothetical protein [Acidobacteriaceae bacterium]
MKILLGILCSPLIAITLLYGQQPRSGPWVMEASGTTAGLRGIHAVGGGVAWASGTNGTVLRTEDGGYMWQRCAMPPDAEKLDFRGIWAWDADTAVIMSSGTGDLSRIYKTTDGCAHWKLLFTNPDKDGFWDAIQFYQNPPDGFILGDPVKGHFVLFNGNANGSKWTQEVTLNGLKPLHGEAIFAASNSAFDADVINGFYFGTGGDLGAWFVYETDNDNGTETWSRVRVPVGNSSVSSGIFSIQLRSDETDDPDLPVRNHGVAVGGDYTKPDDSAGTAALTADGGKHWTASAKPPHGFRSAVAWDATAKAWITAGSNGSGISYDDGKTWTPLDNGNWNALSLPWIVGPRGRIAKLDESKLPKN